jgi:hypothetical protein
MVKNISNYVEVPSSNNSKSTSSRNRLYQIPDNFLTKIAQRERSEAKTKKVSKGKHFEN